LGDLLFWDFGGDVSWRTVVWMSYSKADHAAYMRAWRRRHPLDAEGRRRDGARSYARVYLRRGKLAAEPCVVCGAVPAQMHHPDYAKPLEVVWFCALHHRELHRWLKLLEGG
jgi:hypothetical protein